MVPRPSQLRQAAVRRGPRKSTRELMDVIVDVLDTFDGSMSTRQIYYQCVSRGEVQNCTAGYDKVQRLVVSMRREGIIPFDRVVDRTRAKHQRPGWDGPKEIMQAVHAQFRRDLWAEQDTVVMIACEKQALEGIFAEACDEYGASLWTVHGFASLSFAYEWANEIKECTAEGKRVAIAYFGDFDPSGLCIERKITEQLEELGARFSWERAGLIWEDFDEFDLVNVPVKQATDSRAKAYLKLYGNRAAELDALRPDELRRRVKAAITSNIDVEPWNRLSAVEAVERESLSAVVRNWDTAVAAARGAA